MFFTTWLRSLRSYLATSSAPQGRKHRRRSDRPLCRPRLETLEDRLAPATLTVNSLADNTSDTSVLTLRDAVTLVNNGGNPASLGQSSMPAGWAAQIDTSSAFGSNDGIDFAPGLSGTITLSSGELDLTQNVTINGPGAGQLAVSGMRDAP